MATVHLPQGWDPVAHAQRLAGLVQQREQRPASCHLRVCRGLLAFVLRVLNVRAHRCRQRSTSFFSVWSWCVSTLPLERGCPVIVDFTSLEAANLAPLGQSRFSVSTTDLWAKSLPEKRCNSAVKNEAIDFAVPAQVLIP
mmetsp:Transcript_5168/g.7599  ORF Transcript_5168/g.7599 Transcript_5168/m.7599 type:complete len:140 (-) Transcript_5168:43-462(-)